MRKNLPVTDIEYPLGDDTLIVSKTDTKGKLTYFNDQFVEASGFTEAELAGQPHNIVRHPDMPPEAFEDLWNTLKAGKPWAGAVKNRRKNGDFYWVLASATPIWENGQITGYMSIRTKLPFDQREEAERVYALFRANKVGKYLVSAGVIRRKSWSGALAMFSRTLKARLTTQIVIQSVFMVLIGVAGILAARDSNARLKSIYQARAVPLAQLFEINDRMKDNTIGQYEAVTNGRAGKPIGEIRPRVESNIATISKVWNEYSATDLTPEEKRLAESFGPKRKAYVENAVKPALAFLDAKKFDEAAALLASSGRELSAEARLDLDKLVAIQLKESRAEFESAEHEYVWMLIFSVGALLVGLLLGGVTGITAIRAISRPIARLNEIMEGIAQGQFNTRVVIERDDEIGIALRNIQAMQGKLGFDREQQRDVAKKMAEQRAQDMQKLANDFEAAVGEIIETVSSASTQLEASAGTLSATAERSREVTMAVSAASEEASANVQSVASATEEMSSSVNEISRQVQDSARIANEAVDQARRTNDRVGDLSQAAGRIGAVVELINTIARQTNLLALNATIEAARAGNAGRGFAVVASEVKALAEQTANATGEISLQINGIQAVTEESVGAIKDIGDTIHRMSEISSSIASAVEQQGAATREISRNVQHAAQGTLEVSSNINDVQRGAGETGVASAQVLSAAQSLSRDSYRLKAEVAKFLNTVRAA